MRRLILALVSLIAVPFTQLSAAASKLGIYDERKALPDQGWTAPFEGIQRITGLGLIPQGLGWTPLDFLHMRIGYRSSHLYGDSPAAGLAAGIEIPFHNGAVAYAISPFGALHTTHGISFTYRFGS